MNFCSKLSALLLVVWRPFALIFPGFVKAGIPANEVLRIATWNGATYARVLADRGSIERGKRADLILIDGDPTRDISTIRNVALVLQDGDAYYPAELYAELGVLPFAPALKPEP